MRKFFSSIWFKCLSVLVAISVVSGGLLAVLNDVLYVSPEERTARAVKSIYGEAKTPETLLDVDDGNQPFVSEKYG